MELSSVQNQFFEPFVQDSIKAMKEMADSDAWAGDVFHDNVWKFKFNGIAIATDTSGAIEGTVLIHHYLETALALGNRVIHFSYGETNEATGLNEKIKSALVDFGTKVIGEATQELQSSGFDVKFKPPYYISKAEDISKLMVHVHEIISIPIHVDTIGRHYLNFLLRE